MSHMLLLLNLIGIIQFDHKQYKQEAVMKSIVCSSIHKLHRSSILAGRSVYCKSTFEQKKIIDRSKTSISLMMEAMQYDVNIDYLKKSNQLGLPVCMKILKLLNQYQDIADICNIMAESQFNNFDSDFSYYNFIKFWASFLSIADVQLQSLQLHANDNLRNFLKVIMHLETKINKIVIRSMLAFLSNYIQNVQNINECIKYEAIYFLTDRSHVSEFIIKEFQRPIVQKQKIYKILEGQDMNEIKNCFETVLYMLKASINLNKLKIQINKQNYEDLLQVFFHMLDHNSTFEYIVGMKIAPMIFIDDIFTANKQKYFKIIHKIIQPTTYKNLRLHRQLIPVIFDKLLLFSTLNQKNKINQILQYYQQCLFFNKYIIDDSFRGNTSLILLCKKFEYYSPFLFYDLFVYYFAKKNNLGNQKSGKKDRIHFKIMRMLRLYEVQILMKMVQGKGLSFQREMAELLDTSVRSCFGYNSSIFQDYAIQQPNATDNPLNSPVSSQKLNQSPHIKRIESYCEKMEKELRMNFKNIIPLNNFLYPINMAANFGARFKIFLQIILCSKELRIQKNLIIEVQEAFRNPVIIKKLEENKYYPGLAEVVFLMYHEGLALCLKIKQAPITTFIQSNEAQFNKKMGKTIMALQSLEQDHENIRCANNIQCLTRQLKIDSSLLYKKSANFFLSDSRYHHIKKYEELNLSVQNFLKELKEKDDNFKNLLFFANNPQFPYIADLLIFYRKKIISIILTSPQQKPILQQHLRQSLQSYKIESNTSSSTTNEKSELKTAAKEEQKSNKKQPSIYNKQLIRHLLKKGHIVFLSNKEDVRRFCINLQLNRIEF